MGEKRQDNRRFPGGMRSGDERMQNLLVTAMDAIEDANGQPGVLEIVIVEGLVLNHVNWSDMKNRTKNADGRG